MTRKRIKGPTPKKDWGPWMEVPPAPAVLKLRGEDVERIRVAVNAKYQVHITYFESGLVHLSFKTHANKAIRDWREMQRIKNELVGPEIEAVELFPAESRLIDTSNQYHLWCLPPGEKFPFGFHDGRHVATTPEDDAELLRQLAEAGIAPDEVGKAHKQRPVDA